MPQWIKIQPLFKINNTQNIQRILECFTARVLTTLAVHEQMYRPVTNDPEGTEVAFQSHTQMLPCLLDFFYVRVDTKKRQGAPILLECIPDWTVACYDAVSLHTSRGQNIKHLEQSVHSILSTDWRVCTKKTDFFKSTCCIFQPFNLT